MPTELESLRRDLDGLRQQFRGAVPIAVQLTILRLEKRIRRLEQHSQGGNHEKES